MDDRLTPSSIYELVAEVGFKKYFHLGGFQGCMRRLQGGVPRSLNLEPFLEKGSDE